MAAQPNVEGSMWVVTGSGQGDFKNTEGGDDCSYSPPNTERTLLKGDT